MRTPFIVANWKMNFTVADALKFETVLTHELKAAGGVEIAIAPLSRHFIRWASRFRKPLTS